MRNQRLRDAVLTVAAAQGGVVSRPQLQGMGVDSAMLRRAVSARLLRPVLGAFAIAAPASALGWAWAMRLSVPTSAVVTGEVALRLWGWDPPRPRAEQFGLGRDRQSLLVGEAPRRQPSSPELSPELPPGLAVRVEPTTRIRIMGLTVMRTGLGRHRSRSGGAGYDLLLAEPVEALLDYLVLTGTDQATAMVDHALQCRWLTPDTFANAVQQRCHRGRPGSKRLHALAERARTGARSDGEVRLLRILRRCTPGRWLCNVPIRTSNGTLVAEVDFLLEGTRLVVEFDGRAHHSDAVSFQRDRARQNQLLLMGYQVVRFTWDDVVRRPNQVVATVSAAIRTSTLDK